MLDKNEMPKPADYELDTCYSVPPDVARKPRLRYIMVRISKYRYVLAKYNGMTIFHQEDGGSGKDGIWGMEYEICSKSGGYHETHIALRRLVRQQLAKENE